MNKHISTYHDLSQTDIEYSVVHTEQTEDNILVSHLIPFFLHFSNSNIHEIDDALILSHIVEYLDCPTDN